MLLRGMKLSAGPDISRRQTIQLQALLRRPAPKHSFSSSASVALLSENAKADSSPAETWHFNDGILPRQAQHLP